MVSTKQNGKVNHNGRTSRATEIVGVHQAKRPGTKRKAVTAWLTPDETKLVERVADSRGTTVSAVAASILRESLHRTLETSDRQSLNAPSNVRPHVVDEGTQEAHLDRARERRTLRLPSLPRGAGEMQDSAVANFKNAQPCAHPVGDIYFILRRENDRAAKILKSIHRLRERHEDILHLYAQRGVLGAAAVAMSAEMELMMTAFDAFMQTTRTIFEESDMLYQALAEKDDAAHGLRLVQ